MSTPIPKQTVPQSSASNIAPRDTTPSRRGKLPYRPFSRTPLPVIARDSASSTVLAPKLNGYKDAEQEITIVLGEHESAGCAMDGNPAHVDVVEYSRHNAREPNILDPPTPHAQNKGYMIESISINPVMTEQVIPTRMSVPRQPTAPSETAEDSTLNNAPRPLRPRMSGASTGAVLRHLGKGPHKLVRGPQPVIAEMGVDRHSRGDAIPLHNSASAAPITKDIITSVSRLPDLLAIRPIRSSTHSTDSVSTLATKPFALTPLPYTDSDVPLPQPYNEAYPHPLTAYASHGVNPAVLRLSGYGKALEDLLLYEPNKASGTILAESNQEDKCVPSLSTLIVPGEGLGLPERLWCNFETIGAVRIPVGVNGVSPFANGTAHQSPSRSLPPRFMARSGSIPETPPDIPRGPDYFAQLPPRRSISSDHGRDYMLEDDRASMRRMSEYDIAASMGKASFGGIPFYKTEICPTWDRSGQCRYGVQCQYAHGIQELRTNYPLPPMPVEYNSPHHIQHSDLPFADQPMMYHRKASLPGIHAGPLPRIELRRASAPPVHLATVDEMDDEIIMFDPHYRPEHVEFASPFPNRQYHSDQDYTPRHRHPIPSTWRDLPPNYEMVQDHTERYLHPNTPGRSITPKASNSSMSTSSSRVSGFTSAIDTSHTESPVRSSSTYITHDDQSPSSSKGSWGKGGLGHTSLDFSSGKSIWC